jgi:hypothetical protein
MDRRCLITVTHRKVEHNDPEAAGFTDGYWWTFTDEHVIRGLVPRPESATAAYDDALAIARDVALALGYGDLEIDLQDGDELLDRADDETRVTGFIDAWAA